MSHTSFVDYVHIFIKAGNGGDGHIGFYRGRGIPKGGPDGGDGGDGGSVYLRGSKHQSTLRDYLRKRHHLAKNGQRGSRQQKNGPAGASIYLNVPLGTLAVDKDTGHTLAEVLEDGQVCLLAKGGKGGLGNVHFKSSTSQTPMKATPGQTTVGQWIILELKLLADIALIGCPNAGKSTLLSTLTRAHSKSADYPFTTLQPFLGMLPVRDRVLRLADMPGLIANAHQGAGLGTQFLRHIERTKGLIFVLEIKPDSPESMWHDLALLEHEIGSHRQQMMEKPRLIVANKADLLTASQQKKLHAMFVKRKIQPLVVSAHKSQGLDVLMQAIDATF